MSDYAEIKSDSDYTQADVPSRETEVRYALNELGHAVGDTGDLVRLLEERLRDVLREPAPEASIAAGIARVVETKHASELSEIGGSARRSRDALRSILDRLEI